MECACVCCLYCDQPLNNLVVDGMHAECYDQFGEELNELFPDQGRPDGIFAEFAEPEDTAIDDLIAHLDDLIAHLEARF